MRISVKVKTNSKNKFVRRISDKQLEVGVSARPQEGKANDAVIEAIAENFGVPKSLVRIKSGLKSKNKILEIGA